MLLFRQSRTQHTDTDPPKDTAAGGRKETKDGRRKAERLTVWNLKIQSLSDHVENQTGKRKSEETAQATTDAQ